MRMDGFGLFSTIFAHGNDGGHVIDDVVTDGDLFGFVTGVIFSIKLKKLDQVYSAGVGLDAVLAALDAVGISVPLTSGGHGVVFTSGVFSGRDIVAVVFHINSDLGVMDILGRGNGLFAVAVVIRISGVGARVHEVLGLEGIFLGMVVSRGSGPTAGSSAGSLRSSSVDVGRGGVLLGSGITGTGVGMLKKVGYGDRNGGSVVREGTSSQK